MGVGDPKDLGLLKQASIYAIYKKNALGAWAEFAEVFGMPLRIGFTDMLDPIARQNTENALKNMGVSSYAVLQKNTQIEYKESTRSDAHQVFKEMIELNNAEISKLILGATGVMDEKSHVGAANVHMRISENIMFSDEQFIEDLVNNKLKEILVYHGFPVQNLIYKISDVEDIALEDRAKISTELIKTGKYFIPTEYIEKTFGIPCEKVEEPVAEPVIKNKKFAQNIIDELSYLYP
jgi:phage gp29-like protein